MRMNAILGRMALLAAAAAGHYALQGQVIEARISAEPLLSPDAVERLEAKVRANPADRETRLQLLRHYVMFAPRPSGAPSPVQSARLNHVLYVIENFPSDPVASSPLTYVPAANGWFADATDHATVRDAWMRAADRLPSNTDVLRNAARFLYQEHPEDAEQFLSRAVDRNPGNRRVAANLGFLYAMDILGISSPQGRAGRPAEERQRLLQRSRLELERTRNVFVLAGAGTALPNLFPRTEQARNPDGDRSVFELASALMARARELSPSEAELAGPMPLVREFQAFQQSEVAQTSTAPVLSFATTSPAVAQGPPAAVRIGGAVLAAKLVEKPEAMYPPEAKEARIQGVVRLNVLVRPDGSVENATLVSGHPLLVPAALEAVRRYRYHPVLLNGSAVSVVSQVDVPFTFSK